MSSKITVATICFLTLPRTVYPLFFCCFRINDIDVISRPNVPLRIKGDGRVIWTPGGVFVTHCESDITYYPLDTQVCDIVLSTWAYTANEVNLILAYEPIGREFFKGKTTAHSKTGVKQPLSKRPTNGSQDQLSLNAGKSIAECYTYDFHLATVCH